MIRAEKSRDPELVEIETRIRTAVGDVVNRESRKPFYWGGLKGFQQLDAIAKVLHEMVGTPAETAFFHQLTKQVGRALDKIVSLRMVFRELMPGCVGLQHTWDIHLILNLNSTASPASRLPGKWKPSSSNCVSRPKTTSRC